MSLNHNPRELMNYWAKELLVRTQRRPQRYLPMHVAARTAMVLCVHRMTATALTNQRIRYRCDLCRCSIVVNRDGEIIV